MRKVTGKFGLSQTAVLIAAAALLLLTGLVTSAGAAVSIATPGAVLKDGDTCSSAFATGGHTYMTVELSYDGGTNWEAPPLYDGPVAGAPNPLVWQLPVSFVTSTNCKLMITCSTGGSSELATSGLFTIDNSAPSFTSGPSVSPNSWTKADIVNVSWLAADEPRSDGLTAEYRIDSSDNLDYSPNDSPVSLDVAALGLADGKHTIDVRLTDAAGNQTTKSVDTFIDRTAPNAFTPVATPAAWSKGPISIGFNTSDPGNNANPQTGSGIDHYEVSVEGVDYGEQVSPFVLDVSTFPTGTYAVNVTAVDLAGNERTGHVSVQVDNDPPSPFDATPDKGDWTNGNVNVSFLTSDPTPGSGIIDHYEVSVDGGDYTPCSSPYTTSLEGAHTLYIKAVDGAGNARICNSPVYTQIDKIAPHLDGCFSGPASATGEIPVDYTASDGLSGIKRVTLWYKNGASGTWTNSGYSSTSTSNTFFFNGTGGADPTYYFGFVIEDKAGNIAASNTGDGVSSSVLDLQGPTFSAITASPHYAKVGTEVTIAFTASEELKDDPYLGVGLNDGTLVSSSGLDYTFSYTVQATDPEGPADIYIEGIDLASNYAWTDNYDQLVIDTTPPADFTPTASPAGWTGASSISVSFDTSDSGSGIDHYEVAVDSGAYSVHASPCSLDTSGLGEGAHTVHVKAVDMAGNERIKDVTIYVDKSAPADFTPAADPSGWTKANSVQVTFNAADAGSGIDRYEVALDGGAYSTHTSPYALDVSAVADGTHTVHVKAIDKVGNATVKDVSVHLDRTGPLPFTPVSNPTDWTGAEMADISWSTTDACSGIDHYEVALGTGAYTAQTSPYRLVTVGFAPGTYTVHVKAVDALGNATIGDVTAQVTQTSTPITASLTVTDPSPTLGRQFDYILWKNWMGSAKASQNTYDVKWTTADPASVVNSVLIEYRVGSGSWTTLANSLSATGTAHLNVSALPETDNLVFRVTCRDRLGNSAIVFSSPYGLYDATKLVPCAQITAPTNGAVLGVGTTVRVTVQECMPVFKDPRNPTKPYKEGSPDWWFSRHLVCAAPRLVGYKTRGDGKPTSLHKTLVATVPRKAPEYTANTNPAQAGQFLTHVLVNTWETNYALKKGAIDTKDTFQAEMRYADVVSVGGMRQPDKSSKLGPGSSSAGSEPMAKTLNQYEYVRFWVK